MDLGGREPQDLKDCIARRKIGEGPINKTIKKLFMKTH